MNSKKKYKLNYLSADFFIKYNSTDYPEIENKDKRPYMVVLVKIENNTFAIPFRTNIPHNNCYRFKNSSRSTQSVTGLDFTKAVVVNDSKYIGVPARIDNKEYVDLNRNYLFIIEKFKKYVSDYIKFVNSNQKPYYAAKKFKFTTLKYFHDEILPSREHKKLCEQINIAKKDTNKVKNAYNKSKNQSLIEK